MAVCVCQVFEFVLNQFEISLTRHHSFFPRLTLIKYFLDLDRNHAFNIASEHPPVRRAAKFIARTRRSLIDVFMHRTHCKAVSDCLRAYIHLSDDRWIQAGQVERYNVTVWSDNRIFNVCTIIRRFSMAFVFWDYFLLFTQRVVNDCVPRFKRRHNPREVDFRVVCYRQNQFDKVAFTVDIQHADNVNDVIRDVFLVIRLTQFRQRTFVINFAFTCFELSDRAQSVSWLRGETEFLVEIHSIHLSNAVNLIAQLFVPVMVGCCLRSHFPERAEMTNNVLPEDVQVTGDDIRNIELV